MPPMTEKEAVEKLREYYYPDGSTLARREAFFSGNKLYVECALFSPDGVPIYGTDFETCFDVLDRLIAEGRVKSGIPGDTAPEIDPELYGHLPKEED